MPRIRTIKPEFWDSPGTARASLPARLLFIAMWNWADDYGVGTANARQLMGFAFPNDPDLTSTEFPRLRTEVAECYDVEFYEVDGRPYYSIPSWDKHQKNERKATRRHPGPDKAQPVTRGISVQTRGSSAIGTGEQGNRGIKTPSPTAVDDDFDEWWKHYPKKVDKGHARTAYRTARKKTDATTLLGAVSSFAELCRRSQTKPEFIPHASTWLNGERWSDAPASGPVKSDPVAAGMWEGAY